MFHVINKIMKGNSSSSIPITANLCDGFLDFFFNSKIDKARNYVSTTSVSADLALNTIQFSGAPLSNFFTLDLISLSKEVSQMKAATSIVDPVYLHVYLKHVLPVWALSS